MWYDDVLRSGFDGLKSTVWLSICSLLISLMAGLALGIASHLYPRTRLAISLYTMTWRGLPVLVTLFAAFFLLPLSGVRVSGSVALVTGLSLWGSAYITEITIGALQGVPRSQSTAARALGFGKWGALLYVLFPQAIRRMLPSMVTIMIAMIQATSLAARLRAA